MTSSHRVVHLLDANVLGALTFPDHVHHEPVRRWFGSAGPFATCPSTQGSLLRAILRSGTPIGSALAALDATTSSPRHQQWLDDLTYGQVDLSRVAGHRQVTDAYLAQLARAHSGRLATLDRGLAVVAGDVVDLVPV